MGSRTSAAVGRPQPNKWVVLFTVVAMTFMSTLDSSIVNIALPVMQDELGASAAGIQWVSTVYLLSCCTTVLVFGRLGDLWGKVRLFQLGVAVFTLGSLLCGLLVCVLRLCGARARGRRAHGCCCAHPHRRARVERALTSKTQSSGPRFGKTPGFAKTKCPMIAF